jgi:hypothetical protein
MNTNNHDVQPVDLTEGKRESKSFWCINGHAVIQSVGWSCTPSTPDYWWFPELGFSGAINVHCFETEGRAKAALKKKLLLEIQKLEAALKEIL